VELKGCISIEQTRKGHIVRVFLPSELNIKEPQSSAVINIEGMDLFNREYVSKFLEREQYKCFYCLKSINKENCELDHVVAQAIKRDNSYRNIVAACHKCNTHKQGSDAKAFLRELFRKDLLDENDFLNRKISMLAALESGSLKPCI
jgi:hypothetical protein